MSLHIPDRTHTRSATCFEEAIRAYLAERNQNPKRYVWRAKGEDLLRKIQQARQTLLQRQVA